jgi:hypothetical protein
MEHPLTTTIVNTDRSFHLSRIYAMGWNAAKAMTSDALADLDAKTIASLNPCRQEDERKRWREGFAGGSIR